MQAVMPPLSKVLDSLFVFRPMTSDGGMAISRTSLLGIALACTMRLGILIVHRTPYGKPCYLIVNGLSCIKMRNATLWLSDSDQVRQQL